MVMVLLELSDENTRKVRTGKTQESYALGFPIINQKTRADFSFTCQSCFLFPACTFCPVIIFSFGCILSGSMYTRNTYIKV